MISSILILSRGGEHIFFFTQFVTNQIGFVELFFFHKLKCRFLFVGFGNEGVGIAQGIAGDDAG